MYIFLSRCISESYFYLDEGELYVLLWAFFPFSHYDVRSLFLSLYCCETIDNDENDDNDEILAKDLRRLD